jgi:DHA1 family inner membrane transport protein
MHAPFFGVCMSVAATIAPPAKKTQAIALVQAGLTIAVMIGVPFGSFLGSFTNWRAVFGIMVLLAVDHIYRCPKIHSKCKFKYGSQCKG